MTENIASFAARFGLTTIIQCGVMANPHITNKDETLALLWTVTISCNPRLRAKHGHAFWRPPFIKSIQIELHPVYYDDAKKARNVVEEQLIITFLHEVAHAVDYIYRKESGHDGKWKAQAELFGIPPHATGGYTVGLRGYKDRAWKREIGTEALAIVDQLKF